MRKGWLLALTQLLLACSNQESTAKAAAAAPPQAAPAPVDEVPPGVDLAKLDEGEKKIFFRVANKAPSACGKAHSLLHSVKNDGSCKKSIFALRYAAKLSHEGYLESEIIEALDKRYAKKPVEIDLAEVPSKGDPNALVTIVEFADFECPHCRHLQPLLERLLDDYKGKVRVFFKNFPLKSHTNAEGAATAAAAAQRQGKFWALSAKLWQNQEALSPPDLERYAKEAGLDLKKFRDDLGSAPVKERVAKDRAEGDRLNLSGTPVVFINGRECPDATKDYEALKAWVDEELAAR